MHAPGLRALRHSAATALRAPRYLHRTLRTSPIRLNSSSSGADNGGKPTEEPNIDQDAELQPQTGLESLLGRSKPRAASSARSRLARKQSAPSLPPVKLPQSFLDDNVTLHDPFERPRLPFALAEDVKPAKPSSIFIDSRPNDQNSRPKQSNETLEKYFEYAHQILDRKASGYLKEITEPENGPLSSLELIDKLKTVTRTFDMMLDSAWHMADALYPARHAKYEYTSRPFWWWHYYKNYDRHTQEFSDQFLTYHNAVETMIDYDVHLDHSLSQAMADLPIGTFHYLASIIDYSLSSSPPPNSDARLKRQIPILSMSGYGGQAVAESIARHVAFFAKADLVRLDAQDISDLVGGFLGQDVAYSRGPVSTMGFRVAEMNGKLSQGPEPPNKETDEDAQDSDAGLVIRASTLEGGLAKLKAGNIEPFRSRWDFLKIEKFCDHLLQAAEIKAGSPREKPLIIHIHDFVELKMTLEGDLILDKLRTAVDAAWQQGSKIAILATSSSEKPSDEYQAMLNELAATDFLMTRHIDPGRTTEHLDPADGETIVVMNNFPLQDIDFLIENVKNINRVLRALGGKELPSFDQSSHMRTLVRADDARISMFKKALLPLPELFSIACSAMRQEEDTSGLAPAAIYERLFLGPLRQQPGQRFLDEVAMQKKTEASAMRKQAEEPQAVGTASLKLNEYEKRISTGQINPHSLRTTFADVHVPKETISALKLLTSLALVRPDAFSYGVLAQDKITGCLLYGPPGTGKTLLAKAVAKESGANMLEISGAMINDKWVGEGEKLIHAIFTLSKKISPCVVFIDEADSLLANRSMLSGRSSHRSLINQFLKEWDGLEETEAFIMVATNRPFDLDDAILRRLPRRLLVDLPLKTDRAAILKILLKGEELEPSISLDDIAARTPFYSGSDLKNACVAAAMAAVEEENEAAAAHTGPEPHEYPKKRTLRQHHFDRALKQIPASISEDMASLKQIRKFDEEYGAKKRGTKKMMGFGIGVEKKTDDTDEARIRRE